MLQNNPLNQPPRKGIYGSRFDINFDWNNRSFWRFWIFFLPFSIIASAALDKTAGILFRHLSPVYFSAVFFILVLFSLNASRIKREKFPFWVKITLAIVALVAVMVLVSLNWVDGIADTLRWAYIFLIIGAFGKFKLNIEGQRIALLGVVAGSLYHGLWLLGLNDWNFFDSNTTIMFIDRNITAATMLCGIWACIFLLTTSRRKSLGSLLLIILLPVFFYWMLFTFSRSSLLISAATLLIFTFSKSRNFYLVLLIATFAVASYSLINKMENYSDRILLKQVADPDAFSEGRVSIWLGIFEGLPSTNFLGAGTSNLRFVLSRSPSYLISPYGRTFGPIGAAHSMFLKLLAENGVLGALLFIIFLGGMFNFSWVLRRKDIFPLIGVTFCFILGMFFDYVFAPWVLCAIFLSPFLCVDVK